MDKAIMDAVSGHALQEVDLAGLQPGHTVVVQAVSNDGRPVELVITITSFSQIVVVTPLAPHSTEMQCIKYAHLTTDFDYAFGELTPSSNIKVGALWLMLEGDGSIISYEVTGLILLR